MTVIIIISTPGEGSMGPALKTMQQASKLGLPRRKLNLPGAVVSPGFGVMCFSG